MVRGTLTNKNCIETMTKKLKRLGIVFVVSGPSGAGKSTLCQQILAQASNLSFSVSCTTRARRSGEENGKDYYFISRSQFQDYVDDNAFVEHAEVHGEFYGTLRLEVENRITVGEDVLLDIDVQGVTKIQRQRGGELWSRCVVYVFIGPPSFEALERRLRTRGTETETRILSRLTTGTSEIKYWKNYDYLILNTDIGESVKRLQAIVQAERLKTSRINENPWQP